MRKFGVVAVLFAAFAFLPSAKAVDPATMTAAAPKALELASIWSPHTISTMQSAGIGLMEIGKSTASILLLPAGILQCTLGVPFGMLDNGVQNCISGFIAPFELIYQIVLFPVRIVSLGTVR